MKTNSGIKSWEDRIKTCTEHINNCEKVGEFLLCELTRNYSRRAENYAILGEYSKAIKDYLKLIELENNPIFTYKGHESILIQLENFCGLCLRRKSKICSPEFQIICNGLGECYLLLNDKEKADLYFELVNKSENYEVDSSLWDDFDSVALT